MYLQINIKKFIGLLVISLSLNFSLLAQENVLSEVKLSSQEQVKLNQGKVILKGQKGKYTGQVLATGNLDTAWNVLTDYNNFKKFMPNIVSSRVIEAKGDRKIFEQVNQVDLLFFKEQYTVQIAATESKPQKIDFKIFKGDLKQLQGTWQLQKVSSNKVLVTHSVIVEPEAKTEKAFFYGIYESCLENTLKAIATEITKRSK
jgi:ribosome-associated toxin RatA of RatAB toxin-antitoxin module